MLLVLLLYSAPILSRHAHCTLLRNINVSVFTLPPPSTSSCCRGYVLTCTSSYRCLLLGAPATQQGRTELTKRLITLVCMFNTTNPVSSYNHPTISSIFYSWLQGHNRRRTRFFDTLDPFLLSDPLLILVTNLSLPLQNLTWSDTKIHHTFNLSSFCRRFYPRLLPIIASNRAIFARPKCLT